MRLEVTLTIPLLFLLLTFTAFALAAFTCHGKHTQ